MNHPCPNCGYCPCCGRTNTPYNGPYRYHYPWGWPKYQITDLTYVAPTPQPLTNPDFTYHPDTTTYIYSN